MPTLNTQTFGQMVRTAAAAVQSAASTAITFAVGSVELALVEAFSSLSQWLQSLIVQLLAATRLSTSQGTDVDTWVGDFGLTRLPAIAATGTVVFSRLTPTLQAIVSVGTQIAAGSVLFTVIADLTQPTYSAAANGYVLAPGVPQANVTVTANVAGTTGNVTTNAITTIQSPITGIDAVTNPAPFVTGAGPETDAALKARFQVYIAGLKQGVGGAVQSVIEGLGQGIEYALVENQNWSGGEQVGHFYVAIWPNDSTLINLVYGALQPVRSLGITYSVHGAGEVLASVSVNITPAPQQVAQTLQSAVQDAISEFIANLTIGQPLYYTQLFAVIYGVPGVLEATGLTINGGTADITATNQQIIQPGTIEAVIV